MQASITIENFIIYAHLGVLPEERIVKQAVRIDISIQLQSAPKACITDNIQDTICYSAIINSIQQFILDKEFQLIEYLGAQIYELLQSMQLNTSEKYDIKLKITKWPQIHLFNGSVCLQISD